MALTIHRKGESRYVHSLIQNLADVPGGVTIATADLIPGTILNEGAYVGKPDSAGICHIIKSAQIYEAAGASATSYKIAKGSQLKVGDVVTTGAGKAAYAITAINTTEALYDTITVGTTLGAATKGATIIQVATAGASAAVAAPLGRLVEFYNVKAGDNIFAPVVVIGTFHKELAPANESLDAKLPGIVLV